MSKSIKVYFDRQEGNKVFLRTESGEEVSFDRSLFNEDFAERKEYFLSLNDSSLEDHNGRQVLNDLLNADE